ncbi:MAG: HEAT repeat domain-containing protein [Planctomycetales bacterium]|nr:HEAT repeat domain-containing protein [Planctomycetales bacterium]
MRQSAVRLPRRVGPVPVLVLVLVLVLGIARCRPAATPPPLPPLPQAAGSPRAELRKALDGDASEENPGISKKPESDPYDVLIARLGGLGAEGWTAERAAADALRADAKASRRLAAALSGKGPALRRAVAAQILGEMRERRAIPVLEDRVLDLSEDPRVVEACAEALAAIGERAALPALTAALYELRPDTVENQGVRVALAAAEAALGSRDGVGELVSILLEFRAGSPNRPKVFTCERASRALVAAAGPPTGSGQGRDVGRADPFSHPQILEAAGKSWGAWWDENRRTWTPHSPRVVSPELLPEAVRPHWDALEGSSFYFGRRARRVLVALGPDGLPWLLHALRDAASTGRRSEAASALGDLADRAAVPHLAWALAHDPAGVVRREAAKSLGALGGPEARAALERAASDPDPEVREAARAAPGG